MMLDFALCETGRRGVIPRLAPFAAQDPETMSRLGNRIPLLRKLCLAMVALIALVSSVQASEGGGTAAEATPSLDGQAPAVYDGTPVGFTDEGHAYRGDPKAPVTMVSSN